MQKLSWRLKLIALFAGILSVSLLIQIFYVIPYVRNQEIEKTKIYQEEITQNIARELDVGLNRLEDRLQRMSRFPEFRNMDIDAMQKTIMQQVRVSGRIATIAVMNSEGLVVVGSNKYISNYMTQCYADRSYFTIPFDEGKTYYTLPCYYTKENLIATSICIPIESESGDRAGVLIGVMNLNDIIKRVADYPLVEGQVAYIIDKQGTVVAHSDIDLFALENGPLSLNLDCLTTKDILSSKINGSIKHKHEKEGYCVSYVFLESNDWGVIVDVSMKSILAQSSRVSKIILLIELLLFAIALIITIIFANQITEAQRKTEKMLWASKEYLEKLFLFAPDAYYMNDIKGNFVDGNIAAEQLLGYKKEELIGKNFFKLKLLSVKQLPKAAALLAKNALGKPTDPTDFEIKRKDGSLVTVEIRNHPIKVKGKTLILGIARDLTERKQAEERIKEKSIELEKQFKKSEEQRIATLSVLSDLKETSEDLQVEIDERKRAEERFRMVSKVTTDLIYEWDIRNDGLEWFGPLDEALGYNPGEIHRTIAGWVSLIHPDDQEKLKDSVERHRTHTNPIHEEYRMLHKDGTWTYWLDRGIPLLDTEGKPYKWIGGCLDITERKLAEKEREQALLEARQANEVKDLFLANMSHEIRTPLNAILGFSQIIEESFKGRMEEGEHEYFEVINSSGQRLIKTVHGVLDISQIEAGVMPYNPEVVRLATPIESIFKEFRPVAAAKKLEFTYASQVDDGTAKVDESSVVKAVSNLVDNAIKYTKEGQINIQLNEQKGKYILSISDTGIGIGDDYLANIYDAFSQESTGYTKKYQGLGLGLSITKSCLDMNGIPITVESKQGVGTTFSLTFTPVDTAIAEPETKTKPIDTKIEKTVSKVKPVVLLVEDDLHNRRTLEVILKGKYETPYAVSVAEGKQQLRKHKVDLIILDLSLEGDEDGLDLVAYMKTKKRLKDIPVIAVTAHAFPKDRDNVFNAGCDDYMSKPIDIKELLGMVSKYCS